MRLEQRCSRAYIHLCGSNRGIVHQFDAQCTTPRGPGQTHLNSDAKIADEGRPQGAPLPIVFSRRYALRRAPTRGAPTNCLLQALCLEEGTHKGRPYQLSSPGVMPWGGHPQGAPLPIVFSRRYALYQLSSPGVMPYQLSSPGVMPWGGRPQGAPLPIVFSRRYALRRAPTRGAPTNCLLQALCLEKGAHKGRPYQLSSPGVMPWGGRYALRRAPTRGAPTRFRQPHVGLSQFDAIALPLARSKNSDATIIYQCQHERRRGQESAEPVNLFCRPAAISRPAKLGVLR